MRELLGKIMKHFWKVKSNPASISKVLKYQLNIKKYHLNIGKYWLNIDLTMKVLVKYWLSIYCLNIGKD